MTEVSCSDWEMAVALPLGVVADQLRRIDAQLRFLNMTAVTLRLDREPLAARRLIEARLEQIGEAIASISRCVSDIDADIHGESARPPGSGWADDARGPEESPSIDDEHPFRGTRRPGPSKRRADLDD